MNITACKFVGTMTIKELAAHEHSYKHVPSCPFYEPQSIRDDTARKHVAQLLAQAPRS